MGEWEHDKRHGRGRYIFKNGITNDRMWEIGEEQQKKADLSDIIDKIKKGQSCVLLACMVLLIILR